MSETTLKPSGRPPNPFNHEQADEFLERLEAGEPISDICRDPHMMSWVTVQKWKREIPEFAARYARAREASAEAFELQMLDVAMSATPEDFQHKRLIVDALKWAAAKRHPRVYGDKIEATVTINTGLADRLNAAVSRVARVIDVEAEALPAPDADKG